MEDLNVDLNTLYYDAHLVIRSNVGVAFKIRESLSGYPNRLEMFRRSCFGSWLDLECDNRDPGLVHLILQTQYMPNHDIDYLLFSVGGQELRFTRREFCLISGLRFGPQNWSSSRFANPFRDRVFGSRAGKSIKGRDLRYVFENQVDQLSDTDHVRVCLLLLLFFGFLGCEAKLSIDDRVLVLIEDLAAWNHFPWGSYSWDATFRTLRNAVGKRQALHFNNVTEGLPTYSLSGFVWAFKIWIYEVFPYGRLSGYCLKRERVIPRGIAWRRTIFGCPWEVTRRFVTTSMQPGFLPIRELIPTQEEQASSWWIESQPFLDGVDIQPREKRPRGAPEFHEIPDPTRDFHQSQTSFPGFQQSYTPTRDFHQSPCPAFNMLDPRVSTLERQYTTHQDEYKNLYNRFEEYYQTNETRALSLEKQLMELRLVVNENRAGTHSHQDNTNRPETEFNAEIASPQLWDNDDEYKEDHASDQTPPMALRRSPRLTMKGPQVCTPYTVQESSDSKAGALDSRQVFNTKPVPYDDDIPKHLWASSVLNYYLVENTQYCYLALDPAGLGYNKEFWGLLLGMTGNSWLESEHIDAWVQYLILTSTSRDPRCAVVPSFFRSIFKEGPRVIAFANGTLSLYPHWSEIDRVLIPLNLENKHWVLGELSLKSWTLLIYDSSAGGNWSLYDSIKRDFEIYLPTFLNRIDYWKRIKKKPRKTICLTIGSACGVPQQKNGWDCGVFVCHFIERLLDELPLTIDGDHEYWGVTYRKKMADALYSLRCERGEYQGEQGVSMRNR